MNLAVSAVQIGVFGSGFGIGILLYVCLSHNFCRGRFISDISRGGTEYRRHIDKSLS